MTEVHEILKTAGLQPSTEEQYLDNQEACQLLKVSKRTLQSYRLKKILPYTTMGGKIYFRMSDIQEHLRKKYVNGKK